MGPRALSETLVSVLGVRCVARYQHKGKYADMLPSRKKFSEALFLCTVSIKGLKLL